LLPSLPFVPLPPSMHPTFSHSFFFFSVGSVTFTGSLVAFGKLDGRLSSTPLKLASRDQINMGLGAATLGTGAVIMGAPEAGAGLGALSTALTTSGALGWHMTASIGGYVVVMLSRDSKLPLVVLVLTQPFPLS
jgi:NAD/NADP transhydrogenase beta subunit